MSRPHQSHQPAHPVQEGEAYDIVPGSQFSVARTAHRSNQSDYYIDNKKVSTKDVSEKLKGKGIDLDNNRFLILQVRRFHTLSHQPCFNWKLGHKSRGAALHWRQERGVIALCWISR